MDDAKALQFIEEVTENADKVQQATLAGILSENRETEYLKRFNLDGATDREAFKSKVPVVTYEDILPFIRRIADGDRSPILTSQPVSDFIISGTSGGEGKLIPAIKQDQDIRLKQFFLARAILNRHVKGLDEGKSLHFMFIKPERRTKGGLMVRSAITRLFKVDIKNMPADAMKSSSSPYEAVCCEDIFQSMYTQMLCGLYERERIIRVGAIFASGLLRVIRFLQLNWRELTRDIRTGSLDSRVDDQAIRGCMGRVLRPEPELANLLARECEKDNWEGIITRIWPNAKFIDTIVTGSMSQYIPTVDYYSGGLPVVSTVYVSSECAVGINFDPFCNPSEVSYTFMPQAAYMEFLPLDDPEFSETVDMVNVEIGKEYELVVTTYNGLYRYRVGDIFRVTGFHNSAPQFRFLARRNVLLSIDADKTDETTLQGAVERAYKLLDESKVVVVDYTSYADTTTIPGHYVIFWELLLKDPDGWPSGEVVEQCCLAMEEAMDSVYRRCRVVDKSIGPLEIRIVERGSFEELMDYAVEKRSATFSQYKTPKCVKLKEMVELLNKRVVAAHFSPALPHWAAEERL
ncbi:probable indole-3-acetic acid-amido synthetase GH3.1 isoform X2 [Salvia hispanica]|uniref:probable indole-3-acetic acid-amido synthetase GH3.1 isoform X2 n=1 Tax=Salvia hispanica TaxID=49212 RepID=UPI0020093524|nr:probable indole-3-acetic acid-amido synthetase GH3.1 isoform X2 [Salvia hispanica]